MLVYRSAFNGIGSGAGVAWPLFGVVFTLLGGSIGSFLSLALGITTIFLFIGISIAIFYFSYQETINKEQEFQDQFEKHKIKLAIEINNYVNSIYEQYFFRQKDSYVFEEYFEMIISQDLKKIKSDLQEKNDKDQILLYDLLFIIKNQMEESNTKLIDLIIQEISRSPLPTYKLYASGFLGFVGTFGSIAGCSAGVSGLLTGMGVFTSFATFPLLGWSVIALSLLCGLIIAHGAMLNTQEEFQKQEADSKIKIMQKQLKAANEERAIDTKIHIGARNLTEKAEEQKKIFEEFTSLHALLESKKDIKFPSFFENTSTEPANKPEEPSTDMMFSV